MKFGYFLSSEEFEPHQLISQALGAERAGLDALCISDHFHPWLDSQGQSSFVWSVVGALAMRVQLPITTAVTCPIGRVHPAILAQAAATAALLVPGGFRFGIGSGEALNEHILGEPWPPVSQRLDMLEEAVGLMRELWDGGMTTYRGRYFRVDNARLYSLPDTPVPVYVSGFGPESATLAGRIGDGFVSTKPDLDLVGAFRRAGGGTKPAQLSTKVCWAPTEAEAVSLAHGRWRNELVPGQASQELPLPTHFEQVSELVTEDAVRAMKACGPDAGRHVEVLTPFVQSGYDELYLNNIGPYQDEFFAMYRDEVIPELRRLAAHAAASSAQPGSD